VLGAIADITISYDLDVRLLFFAGRAGSAPSTFPFLTTFPLIREAMARLTPSFKQGRCQIQEKT
jgi:hypothetical protein